MPTNIRAGLSVVVALVAVVAFYFENKAGSGLLPWLALGLGAVMLGAIWLFPEAKGTKD
ncbi:MAG: hypothetical protein ACFCUQ_10565 [Kiloniellales bacterium]